MEFRSCGFVINDFTDKNCGDFDGNSWSFGSFNLESENSHDRGIDKETENDDGIIGLLPADPFGMDVRSTGWIQIYERDSGKECYGLKINEVESKIGDHQLFAGLSNVKYEEISVPCDGFDEFVVDNGLCDGGLASMRLKLDSNDVKFDERSIPFDRSSGFVVDSGLCDGGLVYMRLKLDANDVKIDERSITYDISSGFVVGSRLCDTGFVSDCSAEDWIVCDPAEGTQDCGGVYLDGEGEGGEPHDAIFFALCYLDVHDLLMVERVCKSLRDAVRSDNLIWSSIHIYYPLNVRLTDDTLVQITSRAQGTLRCLSLVECINITDNGLKLVLESNPRMTNLSVPGCVRLSVQGILFYLRASNSGKPGIKHLQIGGLLNITDKQFEELNFLLGADNRLQMKARKPQFFRGGHFCLTCDDDRPIDIDMCPMCHKLGLVYDCPAESCQKKHPAAQLCRGCTLCIERCVHCGCCINDGAYEETFSLDCLCWDCWKKCEDWAELKDASSSKSTNYQFFRND